ncbi:MAG: hypothetical protein ACI7YS_04245 [Flavobacterium sp.]
MNFKILIQRIIKAIKTYSIKNDSIEVFNMLTSKTKSIDKDAIKGFSTSVIAYGIWEIDEIIIYLKDGAKISIMQIAQSNFKDIKSALLDKNYNYLGSELPYNVSLYNRIYKYDNHTINSNLGEKRNNTVRSGNSEDNIKRPITNDIKTKIKLIYIPYLIISLAILIAWTFLYWLLFIKLNVFQVDESLISMIAPAVLSLISILIWLNKRIKLLKIDKDHFPFYLIVACISMGCLSYFTHEYIILTTNKLTDLSSISQIEKKEPTKFYTLKNFYLDKKNFSIKKIFYAGGKHSQNLEMEIYIVVPILNSASDTIGSNCIGWYGVKYAHTEYDFISNRSSFSLIYNFNDISIDTIENSTEVKRFISNRMRVFENLDINRFLYLDRITKTGNEYNNYVSAIKNNAKYTNKSDVVLLPFNEPLTERADYNLKAALITFGAGSLLFLLMVINPNLKSEDES